MVRTVYVLTARGAENVEIPVEMNAGETESQVMLRISSLFPEYRGGYVRWDSDTCGHAVPPAAEKG